MSTQSWPCHHVSSSGGLKCICTSYMGVEGRDAGIGLARMSTCLRPLLSLLFRLCRVHQHVALAGLTSWWERFSPHHRSFDASLATPWSDDFILTRPRSGLSWLVRLALCHEISLRHVSLGHLALPIFWRDNLARGTADAVGAVVISAATCFEKSVRSEGDGVPRTNHLINLARSRFSVEIVNLHVVRVADETSSVGGRSRSSCHLTHLPSPKGLMFANHSLRQTHTTDYSMLTFLCQMGRRIVSSIVDNRHGAWYNRCPGGGGANRRGKGDKPLTAKSFGKRVRERREQEGLSQAELAEKVGISRTYLSEIERDLATNLSWRVVESLTIELGLSIEPEVEGEQRLKNLPPGLAEFQASRDDIPEQDILMLASLKFRGKQPTTRDGWALIYNAIEVATKSAGQS